MSKYHQINACLVINGNHNNITINIINIYLSANKSQKLTSPKMFTLEARVFLTSCK